MFADELTDDMVLCAELLELSPAPIKGAATWAAAAAAAVAADDDSHDDDEDEAVDEADDELPLVVDECSSLGCCCCCCCADSPKSASLQTFCAFTSMFRAAKSCERVCVCACVRGAKC